MHNYNKNPEAEIHMDQVVGKEEPKIFNLWFVPLIAFISLLAYYLISLYIDGGFPMFGAIITVVAGVAVGGLMDFLRYLKKKNS